MEVKLHIDYVYLDSDERKKYLNLDEYQISSFTCHKYTRKYSNFEIDYIKVLFEDLSFTFDNLSHIIN